MDILFELVPPRFTPPLYGFRRAVLANRRSRSRRRSRRPAGDWVERLASGILPFRDSVFPDGDPQAVQKRALTSSGWLNSCCGSAAASTHLRRRAGLGWRGYPPTLTPPKASTSLNTTSWADGLPAGFQGDRLRSQKKCPPPARAASRWAGTWMAAGSASTWAPRTARSAP